jgi:hypothetical protein
LVSTPTAPAAQTSWRRPRSLVAAVIAVAVLAGTAIGIWQLESGSSGKNATKSTTVATTPMGIQAEIVSPAGLRDVASRLGRPVYWARTRPGARIEFTQSSDGSTFVRYLTGSAKAGDKRSAFVVVATYAQPNAFERVQAVARRKHYRIELLPKGVVAVTQPATPQNIHVVFPEQPYQVEVYAPRAAEARRIVRSGAVVPVG